MNGDGTERRTGLVMLDGELMGKLDWQELTPEQIREAIHDGMVVMGEAFDAMRDSMLVSVETFEAFGRYAHDIDRGGAGGRGVMMPRDRAERQSTFQRMRARDANIRGMRR